MRGSLWIVAAMLIGLAGCHDEAAPPRVVRTAPTYNPAAHEFNIPARAIQNTRWAKNMRSSDPTPLRGDLPKGDYVLMRRSEDALPAWVDAYYPPQGVVQVQPEAFTIEKFDSVTARDTPYYATAVPTATPASTLRGGTSVIVIRNVGAYREVFTSEGIHGYIPAADITAAPR